MCKSNAAGQGSDFVVTACTAMLLSQSKAKHSTVLSVCVCDAAHSAPGW